jgi:hypothetical protein
MPRILVSILALLFSGVTHAAASPASFPFDSNQLAGLWVENYDTDPACAPDKLKMRMQLSLDGKHLDITYDRRWKTELGEKTGSRATVLSASTTTLVIQYEEETRLKRSGWPQEWELAVVAPGVYRWRETDWEPGRANIVVGIRCSP